MKTCERVQAVYRGKTPDHVPLMLDLSHGYKQNMNTSFNLAGYTEVEQGLVDLHKQIGAGDQVPPEASRSRIARLPALAETHGRY